MPEPCPPRPVSAANPPSPFLRLLRLLAVGMLLATCVTACADRRFRPHKPPSSPLTAGQTLPRVDPGYTQWLERQSLLGGTDALTDEVSGTRRLWRHGAAPLPLSVLLAAAPTWLYVNPHDADTPSLARTLSRSDVTALLRRAGFDGLFLAPTGETDAIWRNTNSSDTLLQHDEDAVVSLHPTPTLGTEDDMAALLHSLEREGIPVGGDIPPAATGLGPDFMLQARGLKRYHGLYATIALPRSCWRRLPSASGEWDVHPLPDTTLHALQREGLLPQSLERDRMEGLRPGGWAVTGEVRGVDGETRRLAYRYSGIPTRPILLWQDPSGRARRVWSAAIIRHTGLQGQTLAGLRLEPLWGLDVRSGASGSATLSPGPEALAALAGEIHRYGGWAVQDDRLPPPLARRALAANVDFIRDSDTAAAAALALLTGDVTALAGTLQAALAANVDQQRVARGIRQDASLDFRPLRDLPKVHSLLRPLRDRLGMDATLSLTATTAGLAAQAWGWDVALACAPAQRKRLEETCLLLLSWRVGLPGLTFLSPQDLTGLLLPVRPSSAHSPLRLPLADAGFATGGRTRQPLAFGTLSDQATHEDSFLEQMARLLHARRKAHLAEGRLLRIITGPPGCLAALTALPDGGYWLLAANFSATPQRLNCPLPPNALAHAHDVTDGRPFPALGRSINVNLSARQARHVRIGGSNFSGGPPS